jgi:hypothetical protein
MKKRLNILLVFALVFSMLMTALASANTAELTTEAKFEALKEAGVLEGLADGSAGLDQSMTRGQLSKVLANLYGLELQPGAAVPGFNEPTASEFYQAGYIQAVVEAGLMIGGPKADGTTGFRPNDSFTVQELTIVLARALELDIDTTATVEGKTAAWATSAVVAVVEAGILEASTDYTVNATRALLVDGAFEVATYIAPEVALQEVASVSAVTTTGVDVAFETVTKAREDVTITVVDPSGNVVAVNPVNLEIGNAEIFFLFETALTEVELGIWVVGGVEFDTAAVAAVQDVLSATNQVELFAALSSSYFANVKAENIVGYETALTVALLEDKDTVAEVQTIVDEVNATS